MKKVYCTFLLKSPTRSPLAGTLGSFWYCFDSGSDSVVNRMNMKIGVDTKTGVGLHTVVLCDQHVTSHPSSGRDLEVWLEQGNRQPFRTEVVSRHLHQGESPNRDLHIFENHELVSNFR